MRIGIPKEQNEGELRVAATPEVASRLIKLGFEVAIESKAGAQATFSNEAYEAEGVSIIDGAQALWDQSDIVLKIGELGCNADLDKQEIDLLHENQTLITYIWPAQNPELLEQLAAKKITVLAMDSVPRISRAQKMDARSSMANIAGYRAVVEAAQHFGRFFTGQITAAGKVPPAKVLVIGVGVAGLSAIGVAKGMGAIVRAFDTRLEVKEQVESVGAEFLELDFKEDDDGAGSGGYAKVMSKAFIEAEMALFAEQAKEVDIIITTALIPGRPAPELVTEAMVASMKEGSVLVDLAAEQGGNCKLITPGEVTKAHGVTLIGYTDLAGRLPNQASQLYGTNLRHLLTDLCPEKNGSISVDMEDEVIRGLTVVNQGSITWPAPEPKLSAAPVKQAAAESIEPEPKKERPKWLAPVIAFALGAFGLFGLGLVAPPAFMGHVTVFVLSCFIGYMVIWNVSPSLHTPLMSVTNAISSIIVVGAVLQMSSSSPVVMALAGIAILITSVNIFGGFAVTKRMLGMFRK